MPLAPLGAQPAVRRQEPAPAALGFEAIYREHVRFVWRTVRRLGVSGVDVDDLVQEVFVVVHRRLDEFEQRSSVKTWLYGIVRRVVSDHRRTRRRKPMSPADNMEEPLQRACDTVAVGPDEAAQQAERIQLLHQILDRLDDEKREVFILSELEQMTMLEIAEATGVNANTISSRLRAARRAFEEALERLAPTAEGRLT